MTEKIEHLRSMHRANRAALSAEIQARNAAALQQQIEAIPAYQSADHIAAYIAIRGEISLTSLIENGASTGKRFYLPVLAGDAMFFAPWSPEVPLAKKGFGLLEPDVDPASCIEPRELDLVLAPLVVFDRQCNRIGQGGGYYDRTFAHKKLSEGLVSPVLMGVAHDSQREDKLCPQSWDVSLDVVVTDCGVYGGAG